MHTSLKYLGALVGVIALATTLAVAAEPAATAKDK
jgi:hypothetical protein